MRSFRLTLFFSVIAAICVLGAWALGLVSTEVVGENLPRLTLVVLLVGAGLGVGLSLLTGKRETKEKSLPPNSGPQF